MAITNERLLELLDATLQGTAHLFCALADALEQAGVDREALRRALEAKIDWLGKNDVDIEVATPVLLAREWLIDPPRDPRDPYGDQPRAAVLRFPPPPRT